MNSAKLKRKMKERDKTYKECADILDISLTSYSNKVNGITDFKLDEAKKLSDFLGCNTQETVDIFLA